MRLHFCEDCYAVQVTDKVPADVMFKDYFYFSSSIGTLRDHFSAYAAEVTTRFLDPAKATVRSQLGGEISREWRPEGLSIRLTVRADRLVA